MRTLLAPPAQVNGLPVLASKPLPDRANHCPGHIVLCLREEEHIPDRWVTWIAYTPDGGKAWLATEGHYFTDPGEAHADVLRRNG